MGSSPASGRAPSTPATSIRSGCCTSPEWRSLTCARGNPATWITDEDARTVCAAALLHDIGHYPFSHAIEELGPPILPHETVGRRLIADPDGEIAPILRKAWQVDPDRVAAMIDPKGRELLPADQTLRGLLSGPLDMDKLDYLPRDARACNVPYGGVDTARLIDSLRIDGGDSPTG